MSSVDKLFTRELHQKLSSVFRAGFDSEADFNATEASVEILEVLLAAAVNGNYDDAARFLAGNFWRAARTDRATGMAYGALLEVLVKKCPALHLPLEKALKEANPFKEILPPLPKL